MDAESTSRWPAGSVRALARLANTPRRVRRRPRTEEDRAMIHRMALLEIEARRAEGRLVPVGEREYELRPKLDASRRGHAWRDLRVGMREAAAEGVGRRAALWDREDLHRRGG